MGDNPPVPAVEDSKGRWRAGSTGPVRREVLIALALVQRAIARELWHLVLPHQKADKATRQALVDLEAAGRVREELRLPDGRKLWCLTRAGHREAAGLLPAGTRISALRPDRDGRAAAYSEHALDVAATAGLLARAGIGHLEAFTTEVEHALPGRRSLFTDLVLRDPGAQVPLLLVEVDRDNESAGTLAEKLTGYRAWCELPAKGVSKPAFAESLRARGADTYELRLWRARYPATGREGLPPVALVLVPGRKRPRPGTKPPTEEEQREQARRDHERLLARGRRVEATTEALWSPAPYWGDGVTARDYHRALPVLATALPLLRARGADAAVWRRFGRPGWHTLTEAVDNPDGDSTSHRPARRRRPRPPAAPGRRPRSPPPGLHPLRREVHRRAVEGEGADGPGRRAVPGLPPGRHRTAPEPRSRGSGRAAARHRSRGCRSRTPPHLVAPKLTVPPPLRTGEFRPRSVSSFPGPVSFDIGSVRSVCRNLSNAGQGRCGATAAQACDGHPAATATRVAVRCDRSVSFVVAGR
ncbi:replication-relaxation family protein [Kitasatospora sp. NPDC090308]|uniref:replication-relaxation family protein n=1 Tax=Kitasatospora sp. NPDC090308 TaxID=3364082 RepID=UPI003815BF08